MYTDIHSDVIWGMDDGARDREKTWDMLRAAVRDGISRIICTPHMTPGVYPFPWDIFEDHFREAQDFIQKENLPLSLYVGAELLYTDLTPRLLREGIRGAAIGVLALAVLAGALILLQKEDDAHYSEKRGTMSENFGQLKTVEWNGQTWREKPAVTTLLIAGIDKPDAQEQTGRYRGGGQADF